MVIIPARIGCILSFVCNIPVTHPAAAPATRERTRPRYGCPAIVIIADTASPKEKLPSIVRSGTLSILKLIYMPNAIIPYIKPCCKVLNHIAII